MTSPGRPTKLNEELIAELEAKAGSYWSIHDACANLGINETTWRNWRAIGQTDEEAGDTETTFARFFRLAMRVGGPRRRTICAGVLQTIIMDKDAKHSDRVAAALGLLRLDATTKMEVSGPDGGALEVVAKDWIDSVRKMIPDASPEDD